MRAFVRAVCPIVIVSVLFHPGAAGLANACLVPRLADDEPSRERLQAWLEGLWGAGLAERRVIFDESWMEIDLLKRILGDSEHEMYAYLVETLEGLIRVEQDDFTLSVVLDRLIDVDGEWIRKIFREALTHESPNVRRRALQRYARYPDDDPTVMEAIDDQWRFEERPWIRANLIGAVACQGAQAYADELLQIARSDDTGLAPIATSALAAIDDWRVLTTLRSMLQEDLEDLRMAALTALASIPASPEAREIVAEVAREGPGDLRTSAITHLADWPSNEGTPVLLELASSAGPPEVRATALGYVWRRDHPDVVHALRQIAEEEPVPETKQLRDLASTTLILRDSPDLAGQVDLPRGSSQSRCPYETADVDPNDAGPFKVVPEPGLSSVRCWSSPEITGAPRVHPRIADWEYVEALDLYEGRELWMYVISDYSYSGCWVRRDSLEPDLEEDYDDESYGPPLDEEGRIRVELDIAPEILGTDEMAELLDAGIVEMIDPAADVVGLALEIDPDNPDAMRWLFDHAGRVDDALDEMLEWVAEVAEERFEDDPVLGPLTEELFDKLYGGE